MRATNNPKINRITLLLQQKKEMKISRDKVRFL
uniref:Uncharacterized protein n=1 Tax=Rhizophora mucronata TaxID=61149 RepID=A0A2P2L426_RHIMU